MAAVDFREMLHDADDADDAEDLSSLREALQYMQFGDNERPLPTRRPGIHHALANHFQRATLAHRVHVRTLHSFRLNRAHRRRQRPR